MIYEIRCNSLTGCLEPVALAGTEKATIGCIWASTDEYASIKDCNGCYLANIDAQTVAVGKDTTALNNSIAIGCGNTTTCDGIAIGNQLTACCDEALISDKVCLSGTNTIVGKGASVQCSATGATVIGANATVCANDNIAIGRGACTGECTGTIVIGRNASATLQNNIVMGMNAFSCGAGSVVINGKDCSAGGDTVAIGTNATTNCQQSYAIGNSCTYGYRAIAIGRNNNATTGTVAIGQDICCDTNATYGVAIGTTANLNAGKQINIGCQSVVSCPNQIAIGTANCLSAGWSAIGIGLCNTVSANCGVAIGTCNNVAGNFPIAIGCGNAATANYATAIGYGSTACGTSSLAIGCCASATGADSVAIGNGATAACGIDIRGSCGTEALISTNALRIGHCISSTDECGFIAGNNINACVDLFNTIVGSGISLGCSTTAGSMNTIIGHGHEIVNADYTGLTVVGSCIDECGIDFKGNINDGDVILGTSDCAFQLCASNGYLYSAGGSCLMTGRILECAACLPASNCSLILYYAP